MIRIPALREFAINTDDQSAVRRELRFSLRSDYAEASSTRLGASGRSDRSIQTGGKSQLLEFAS